LNNIITLFKRITKIPRCSTHHAPFIHYIQKFAAQYGYECFVDKVHNILCKKANSKAKLCIQNHYDIVCLSDNGSVPEMIEENGYLKAKDSTLGADNGIGCAYMLCLMQQGHDCEYLFTSDEEIGLIGANGIEFELQSQFMLNIDSEQEGEICIGCAGGVDIFASFNNKKIIPNTHDLRLYEIELNNLPGGHSGVNIHQNIPNAIKLVAQSIKESQATLLDINGGERINSIPSYTKAIVASKTKPQATHTNMTVTPIDTKSEHFMAYDDAIIDFLYSFAHGVRGFDTKLNVVLSSINLAIIKTDINEIKIELSARSMDNKELNCIKDETVCLLKAFGFKTYTSGKYPAWKPDVNDFTNKVLSIYQKHCSNATLQAIHAGLECALFKEKFPHIKVASIGPNIINPHSKSETVQIDSIHNVYKIVLNIVQTINAEK
jgi:dipeptidase D